MAGLSLSLLVVFPFLFFLTGSFSSLVPLASLSLDIQHFFVTIPPLLVLRLPSSLVSPASLSLNIQWFFFCILRSINIAQSSFMTTGPGSYLTFEFLWSFLILCITGQHKEDLVNVRLGS
ncbi:hypothetical protein BDN67DRAFT_985091 [Paxillus ammoniavirescens]|nr:hypothetical protein BDN67DRAFT_985091 [Paxillus ammoniavirescens]